MQDVNLKPPTRGSLTNGAISKALLQSVITVGAKYSCTVAELQEQLRAQAELLPVQAVMVLFQLQMALTISESVPAPGYRKVSRKAVKLSL